MSSRQINAVSPRPHFHCQNGLRAVSSLENGSRGVSLSGDDFLRYVISPPSRLRREFFAWLGLGRFASAISARSAECFFGEARFCMREDFEVFVVRCRRSFIPLVSLLLDCILEADYTQGSASGAHQPHMRSHVMILGGCRVNGRGHAESCMVA